MKMTNCVMGSKTEGDYICISQEAGKVHWEVDFTDKVTNTE